MKKALLVIDYTNDFVADNGALFITHLGSEVEQLELCGVCTDICILHTAVDAYNKGYNVTIDSKCVASFSQAGHEWALNHFKNVLGFHVL